MQLEEDEFHMLWLVPAQPEEQRPRPDPAIGRPPERMGIVEASPEEEALLAAHGFGSGSVH